MLDALPGQRRIETAAAFMRRRSTMLRLALLGRRMVDENLQPDGAALLVRWAGERLPIPTLDALQVVGIAQPDATAIEEWPDTPHAANTVYWYAVVGIGGGGAVGGIDETQVRARPTNGAGAGVGLIPATPAAIAAVLVAGVVPALSWVYPAGGQQAAPAVFRIFRAQDGDDFDFGDVYGTVEYIPGVSRYEWEAPDQIAAGETWAFIVRAETAGGVRSLTPRVGLSPSGLYDDVRPTFAALLTAPQAAPTAIDSVAYGEVRR